MNTVINCEQYIKAMNSGFARLSNNKEIVNNLNVFPVPDGDTGTNMYLTMQYAIKELSGAGAKTIGEAAQACSSGALMGARGNSGVILSQLFRGLSKSLATKELICIEDIVEAMRSATNMAYKAVMKPTEGTILTVAREMTEFAEKEYKNFEKVTEFLGAVIEAGNVSLDNTPNLLPVLKEANVVDSGGKGLVYFLEGVYAAAKGTPYEVEVEDENKGSEASFLSDVNSEIEFGYCTEFLIKSKDSTQSYQDMLIDKLVKLGDCLLVIEDGGVIKIHVHTEEPWTAMKIASSAGEFIRIKIENMREQHNEVFKEELKAQKNKSYSTEKVKYALIAVSSGSGLSQILKDLGVAYIIEGGQTMNPSTQDFLDIIENTNADNYILLPNNSNIILAASQAKEISAKNIEVLETKNIPQAISALLCYNPENSLESNMEEMRGAIPAVKTAEVTFAVRDTTFNDKVIKNGDIIGISGKEILSNGRNTNDVALEVVKSLADEDSELITLYYGEDMKEKDANKLCASIEKLFPDASVEVVAGMQPLYYYIISVE